VGEGSNSLLATAPPMALLSAVSCHNQHNGDTIQYITVMVSAMGAVPASPTLKYCKVGAGEKMGDGQVLRWSGSAWDEQMSDWVGGMANVIA
jgi:hypothetical protein